MINKSISSTETESRSSFNEHTNDNFKFLYHCRSFKGAWSRFRSKNIFPVLMSINLSVSRTIISEIQNLQFFAMKTKLLSCFSLHFEC